MSMSEIGLVARVRDLGMAKEEEQQFYRACASFLLRAETSNHLRANLPVEVKSRARDLLHWLTRDYYALIKLKQALWLSCKGERPSRISWRLKVKRRDVLALKANCPPKIKCSYRKKIYWPETPRSVEEELVRLAGSTVRREVYQHLAFISRSDDGVGADDLAQELNAELAKVVRLYDFSPTFKVDEYEKRIDPWQRSLSFRLGAQPIRKINKVKVNGKLVTNWTLDKDKITISVVPKSKARTVEIKITYWHHLRALNYIRMAIQRRAHRLVEFHTARCRRRMDSEKQEDGSYRYSHTQISLQTPAGDDDGSRTLEEQLSDPNCGNREAEAVVEVSVSQVIRRVCEAPVVRFAEITMSEHPPADFQRWCFANRGVDPKSLSDGDLVKAAMEFAGIEDRDLDELRSALIQEGIGKDYH